MKRACPYCGRIHDKRNECGRAPAIQKRFTEATDLRNKGAWKHVKRLANERDGYLCQFCLTEGKLMYEDLETHHIIPIHVDPDKAYELENLVTLCRMHHEIAETLPPEVVREKILAAVNPQRPLKKD